MVGTTTPPGSPGSVHPASNLSNVNGMRPRRKRGVSVVSGAGKDHIYKGDLAGDGDFDDMASLKQSEWVPATASVATSESGGRRKREPLGLKKRDYSFLAYHHAEDADKFDDLIAQYKGVNKNNVLAADADDEEQRIHFKTQSRDYLLRVMAEECRRRKAAMDSIPPMMLDTEDITSEYEHAAEAVRPLTATLREMQLKLQLKSIELQKSNLILKQKMQSQTKKLREAKDTFRAHVEGLEDSWEAYLEERQEEKNGTTAARQTRIRQYEEHIQKLKQRKEDLEKEVEKYSTKKEEHAETIARQSRQINKLSSALGLEPEVVPKRKAAVKGVDEIHYPGDRTSSSRTGTTSYTGDSYTSTGSYSSSHCSTCGETLSSTYETASDSGLESWTETDTYSTTYTSYAPTKSVVSTGNSMDSIFTERRAAATPKDGPVHRHASRRKKKMDVLTMVHQVLETIDMDDPQQIQNFLDAQESPLGAKRPGLHSQQLQQQQRQQQPHQDMDGNLHPERGFAFPFV